jgi:hypothetical protein
MEQREGRIQRLAGLAVRRRIGQQLGSEALAVTAGHASPWGKLAELAEARPADSSGLRPWWVLDGAEVRCTAIITDFGWEERRYQRVIEQRLLYRLALGQPHQEDVIDALAARGLAQDGKVRSLGLSPFFDAPRGDGRRDDDDQALVPRRRSVTSGHPPKSAEKRVQERGT